MVQKFKMNFEISKKSKEKCNDIDKYEEVVAAVCVFINKIIQFIICMLCAHYMHCFSAIIITITEIFLIIIMYSLCL